MRKKLDGRTATAGDFALRISKLLVGDLSKNIEPMGTMEIMRRLGFKDKKSVRVLKELAIEMELLEIDEKGIPILPKKSVNYVFKRYDENHSFTSDPLIEAWKRDLLTRKGGSEVQSWMNRLRSFEIVCNTLKTNPQQWIEGKNIQDVLEQGRTFMKNYIEAYKRGESTHKVYASNTLDKVNIDSVRYNYAYACRDFMRFYGYAYPKGETGIMSVTISQFHGKYADVRLTDEELERADKWIKEKHGLDSDEYRCFWIGVEAAPRNRAMWGMTLDYTKHTSEKSGKTTYIMTAYESKTKQIKGGKWIKYITRPDTQKSIDLLKSRGGAYIYEQHKYYYSTDRRLKAFLRELYRFLGKEFTHLERQNDTSTGYFMTHPFHVLRHIGAHYWLIKKKYNFGLVAKLGGWHTIDELKNSYGEMPPEVVLELLEED